MKELCKSSSWGACLEQTISGEGVFKDLHDMIDQTRTSMTCTVNAGLTMIYWQVGNLVRQEILRDKRAEYGKEIVVSLARQLTWTRFRISHFA